MKYCTRKDKEFKNWTKITLNSKFPLWARDVDNRAEWCVKQISTGRFSHFYNTWWFEYPEDAVLFVLKWS